MPISLLKTSQQLSHYVSIHCATKNIMRLLLSGLLILLSCSAGGWCSLAFADAGISRVSDGDNEGVFLVATERLHGTSFQQTVILLTHYSKRGATGLTINRPSGIPLRQALPEVRQLHQRNDPLFLGGPVNTNAIFVLLRTRQPTNAMHHIAADIYFSTGKNAFSHSSGTSIESELKTFAGYTGWGAGQLQNEIRRGDWLMVHTHPDIIFEADTDSLWHQLTRRWTGKWI